MRLSKYHPHHLSQDCLTLCIVIPQFAVLGLDSFIDVQAQSGFVTIQELQSQAQLAGRFRPVNMEQFVNPTALTFNTRPHDFFAMVLDNGGGSASTLENLESMEQGDSILDEQSPLGLGTGIQLDENGSEGEEVGFPEFVNYDYEGGAT